MTYLLIDDLGTRKFTCANFRAKRGLLMEAVANGAIVIILDID